ncbi:GntR family transcriptional regulator [Niveispirillum irakense]|uniref:GntR family transcriptional regulator n=1 Tax=Niveispirillum irakense TaxID=34011 RepID=UPI000422721E|nr:GntR family transcriptional regulator [Niveispirillum irakense]
MATGTAPRYQQIAQMLRAAITNGTYKVGDLLPTEQELCALHDISRHTARDALRLLSEAGLVTRKRRAGTIVTAPAEPAVFVQPLGGFQDLLQYARDAQLKIMTYGPAPEDGLAQAMGLDTAGWWELRGQRGTGPKAVGVTRVLIRADCVPERAEIQAHPTIADAIEARFGIVATRIDQQITAMVLDAPLAQLLGTEPGAAALRTRRLYHDEQNNLFLASETAHPADRFVYSQSFTRERGD